MCKSNIDRFIDLSPFPKNSAGGTVWKRSVGLETKFRYNNVWHTVKILDVYNVPNSKVSRIDILVDDEYEIKQVQPGNLTNVNFGDLFRNRNYSYEVGEVVNGLQILDRIIIPITRDCKNYKNYKYNSVAYNVKCIADGYEYSVIENILKKGHGCPVCAGVVVLKDVNSVTAKYPELADLFVNKEEADTHTPSSRFKVQVKCPDCGYIKEMRISDLVTSGHITCDVCRDGYSYPNKFSRNMFQQLSSQYKYCEFEWSPKWAGRYSYDNYIVLNDGTEIIVEMDGAQHFKKTGKFISVNDDEKNRLAKEHGIIMIRVNCEYNPKNRYSVVKNNTIKMLSSYFDLSEINWDLCNRNANSSLVTKVCEYYENNPKLSKQDIADKFNISITCVYSYLDIGNKLGICKHIFRDTNRSRRTKPIKMYDTNKKLLGTYGSVNQLMEEVPDLKMSKSTIAKYARNGQVYNGRMFEYITHNEWLAV